ncbi:MAG TPA: DUF1508 domain-containing protein [Pyrinomonadaceae bacterium]
MTDNRELMKTQQAKCEEMARGLKSYVKELTETAARHGTDDALIEEDLTKARADLEFYEAQVSECADALGDHPSARRVFQTYKDAAGEWRWRLLAGNDRIIAASGEGYRDKHDCLHGVELVKDSKDARVEDAEA